MNGEKRKPTMLDLVIPKDPNEKWQIGQVIGMSDFDVNFGPVLEIREVITQEIIKTLPRLVIRLVCVE